MNALLERLDAVVPSEQDTELATQSSRILAKLPKEQELRVHLEDGQVLTLPKSATRLLSHLLTEMSHGNAVYLIPIHAELTTQEAADYLNVSRPHLIKLLMEEGIKFRKVGTHRRVKFSDLQEYKEQMEKRSDDALKELASEAQKLNMGY